MSNGTTEQYDEYLRKELEKTALEAAAPMQFTPECQNYVFRAIEESIALRWSSPTAPPQNQRLEAAKTSVRNLIGQMKLEAQRLGRNRLGEDTFFGALNKLCPFWPFC